MSRISTDGNGSAFMPNPRWNFEVEESNTEDLEVGDVSDQIDPSLRRHTRRS